MTQKEMANLFLDALEYEDVSDLDVLDALASVGLVLAPMPDDANPASDEYMAEIQRIAEKMAN